ncbi:expressed unknown protein [Seminavis robusta]|uniref:Methyltransferase FkbM domain-containing protein n=1 Tax=Seminavis robusta TaxID=568900 RepID=A0A9N8DRM3_9STRA|nr:expressed unknown protein [Seminavis robusta]|eukprot:Sro321_g116670.1 n/a (246) ;mRNA; f:14633-15370
MAKMGSSGRVNVSVLLVCLLSMTGLVLELKWGSLSTYAFANVTLNPRGLESVATSDASSDASSTGTASSNAWQPQSGAVGCPGKSKKLSADLFKSQYGEDKVLLEYFGKLCNGTYLEMGALNGVHLSNSHVFHKGLGWKGMLLEASPKNYKELQENRPNELALVHAGICSSQSQLHWVEGKWSPTGGFLEFASQEHQRKFFTPQAIRDAKPVTCSPLGQIIQERLGNQVFFDSIPWILKELNCKL